MNVEELKKEISHLKNKKEILINEREKVEADFEQTEYCIESTKKAEELLNEEEKLYERIEAIKDKIKLQFLTNLQYPSWSTTFGKNIRPEVIKAIKKTFDFSRLSGTVIETIVGRMIEKKYREDKQLTTLKEEKGRIYLARDIISKEKYIKRAEITKQLDDQVFNINKLIGEKESLLVSNNLNEGLKVDKKDLQDPKIKKKILNEYRYDCELKYEEVFKNLEIQEESQQ